MFLSRFNELYNQESLISAAQDGPSSPDYTKLVSSLISELRLFYEIEEMVNSTSGLLNLLCISKFVERFKQLVIQDFNLIYTIFEIVIQLFL